MKKRIAVESWCDWGTRLVLGVFSSASQPLSDRIGFTLLNLQDYSHEQAVLRLSDAGYGHVVEIPFKAAIQAIKVTLTGQQQRVEPRFVYSQGYLYNVTQTNTEVSWGAFLMHPPQVETLLPLLVQLGDSHPVTCIHVHPRSLCDQMHQTVEATLRSKYSELNKVNPIDWKWSIVSTLKQAVALLSYPSPDEVTFQRQCPDHIQLMVVCDSGAMTFKETPYAGMGGPWSIDDYRGTTTRIQSNHLPRGLELMPLFFSQKSLVKELPQTAHFLETKFEIFIEVASFDALIQAGNGYFVRIPFQEALRQISCFTGVDQLSEKSFFYAKGCLFNTTHVMTGVDSKGGQFHSSGSILTKQDYAILAKRYPGEDMFAIHTHPQGLVEVCMKKQKYAQLPRDQFDKIKEGYLAAHRYPSPDDIVAQTVRQTEEGHHLREVIVSQHGPYEMRVLNNNAWHSKKALMTTQYETALGLAQVGNRQALADLDRFVLLTKL